MEGLDAFDQALAQQSEQGSPRWHDARVGRFTSSEYSRLLKSGERLMTDEELKGRPKTGPGSKAKWTEDPTRLSADGETYIYEKVAEVLTGEPKSLVFSYATRHGEEMEPLAAEYFEQRTGLKTQIISFVPFGDHFGGSPDRLIGDDEILEIKCPYNPANQLQYLMLTDQYDLKRNFPEYYWQVMCNLLWTQKKAANFVTYDYRFTDDKHKMAHIKVYPDAKDFQIIADRGAMAVKLKLEILKTLQ